MFSDRAAELFMTRSLAFLRESFPDWAAEKDELALKSFVHSAREFGQRFEIVREGNLREIMRCRIELGLGESPGAHVQYRLNERELDEGLRIEGLLRVLRTGQPTLRVLAIARPAGAADERKGQHED